MGYASVRKDINKHRLRLEPCYHHNPNQRWPDASLYKKDTRNKIMLSLFRATIFISNRS